MSETKVTTTLDATGNLLTNRNATLAGVFTGAFTWVTGLTQEDVIFYLTATVLVCQIIAWVYKGAKTVYTTIKKGGKDED